MDNNKIAGIENYAGILQRIDALFNLSLPEIKKKYKGYPICVVDYSEKGKEEKSIEIRFDEEEITITCLFNTEEKCNFIYLFSDNDETIEGCISYFKDTFEYNYIENRWTTPHCFIRVKETKRLSDNICLVFYYS